MSQPNPKIEENNNNMMNNKNNYIISIGLFQEIECISVDGPLVVSSCRGGYIKVWESATGECRTTILRQRYI